MRRDRLLYALAIVFTALAATFVVLSAVYQLFFLVVAAAFGVTAWLLWYQASGRLAASVRREAWRRPAGSVAGRRGVDAGSRFADGGPMAGQPVGLSETEAYRVLGLDPGADADAVRSAYRQKVKEVHPDTASGDEEAFKRVNEAYRRLSE